jgi:hypothetical protein
VFIKGQGSKSALPSKYLIDVHTKNTTAASDVDERGSKAQLMPKEGRAKSDRSSADHKIPQGCPLFLV